MWIKDFISFPKTIPQILKIDTFCAKLLGRKPEDINYLKYVNKKPL